MTANDLTERISIYFPEPTINPETGSTSYSPKLVMSVWANVVISATSEADNKEEGKITAKLSGTVSVRKSELAKTINNTMYLIFSGERWEILGTPFEAVPEFLQFPIGRAL